MVFNASNRHAITPPADVPPSTTSKQLDALLFLLSTQLNSNAVEAVPVKTAEKMDEVRLLLGEYIDYFAKAYRDEPLPKARAQEASVPVVTEQIEQVIQYEDGRTGVLKTAIVEPTAEELAEFGDGAVAKEELMQDQTTGAQHFVRTVQDKGGHKSKRMSVRQLDECNVTDDSFGQNAVVSYATTTFEGDVGRRHSIKMSEANAGGTIAPSGGEHCGAPMLMDTTSTTASYSGGTYSEATTEYKGNYSKRCSMHESEAVHAETFQPSLGDVQEGGAALVPSGGGEGATSGVRETARSYAVTETVVDAEGSQQTVRQQKVENVTQDAITGEMLASKEQVVDTNAITDAYSGVHEVHQTTQYTEDVLAPVSAVGASLALTDGSGATAQNGGMTIVRKQGVKSESTTTDLIHGDQQNTKTHDFEHVDAMTGQLLQSGTAAQQTFQDDLGTEARKEFAVMNAQGIVDEGRENVSTARGMGEGGSDAVAKSQERRLVDGFTGEVLQSTALEDVADASGHTKTQEYAIMDGGVIKEGRRTDDMSICPETGAVQVVESKTEYVTDAITGEVIKSSYQGTQAIADQTGETSVSQFSNMGADGVLKEGTAIHDKVVDAKSGEARILSQSESVSVDTKTGEILSHKQKATESAQNALGDIVTTERLAIADGSGVVNETVAQKTESVDPETGLVMSNAQSSTAVIDQATGQVLSQESGVSTAAPPAPVKPSSPSTGRPSSSRGKKAGSEQKSAPAAASASNTSTTNPRHFRIPVLQTAVKALNWDTALCQALTEVGALGTAVSMVGTVPRSAELQRVAVMIDTGVDCTGGSLALARWHAQLGGLAEDTVVVVLRLEAGVDWQAFADAVGRVLTQRKTAGSQNEAARIVASSVPTEARDLLFD